MQGGRLRVAGGAGGKRRFRSGKNSYKLKVGLILHAERAPTRRANISKINGPSGSHSGRSSSNNLKHPHIS